VGCVLAHFAGVPLAHPLTQPYHLPLSPVVLAYAAAALVLAVALAMPETRPQPGDRPQPEVASWSGSLSAPQVAVRAVAVALLVLTIAAGRLGADDELENLAPALVVGALWPLLVSVSLLGPVWRWIDPWDAIARALVEEKLAACGNVVPGIRSIYRWQGKIEVDGERLLIMKTVSERISDLKSALFARHPYEVPEFVVLPIERIEGPYRNWLIESVHSG
jgi:periplasmic divalent cation tolerance protein